MSTHEVKYRHKTEVKDLTKQVDALRKELTKGAKGKKEKKLALKVLKERQAAMEAELAARHAAELQDGDSGGAGGGAGGSAAAADADTAAGAAADAAAAAAATNAATDDASAGSSVLSNAAAANAAATATPDADEKKAPGGDAVATQASQNVGGAGGEGGEGDWSVAQSRQTTRRGNQDRRRLLCESDMAGVAAALRRGMAGAGGDEDEDEEEGLSVLVVFCGPFQADVVTRLAALPWVRKVGCVVDADGAAAGSAAMLEAASTAAAAAARGGDTWFELFRGGPVDPVLDVAVKLAEYDAALLVLPDAQLLG